MGIFCITFVHVCQVNPHILGGDGNLSVEHGGQGEGLSDNAGPGDVEDGSYHGEKKQHSMKIWVPHLAY